MADFVYTVALYRVDRNNWDDLDTSTTDIRSWLLDVEEADTALRDHLTTDALLMATGNTEATAVTSYARVTHATQDRTPNTTTNLVDFDLDDAGFGTLGNGVNASISSINTHEFITADSTSIPCSHHDTTFTTDGSSVTIQWAAAGVWRATAS
jgi:hypothetical protein